MVEGGGAGQAALDNGSDDLAVNAAGIVGRELAGRPARWAGESSLQKTPRKFGVVYQAGPGGFPISVFNKELSSHHVSAVEESYTPPVNLASEASVDEQLAPTLVSKLKLDGVTTVVLFLDGTMNDAITNAAANQDYIPEWMITGYDVNDLDLYQKNNNQEEWAHAFGTGYLPPYVVNGGTAFIELFDWYWGKNEGTQDAGTASDIYPLDAGIQLAGPDLTVKSFEKAIATMPPTGGAASTPSPTAKWT